tara:strand:+ start:450 stop:1127 length:678 start_codon:yes stop_codon:yes gene_type:complete
MRELVFSVGITFLTGTLLFVYFRNKMNNIDKKVNLVFNTIQEHNSRMQTDAQEEMKRFQMYHQQQMHEQQMHEQQMHEQQTNNSVQAIPLTEENVNEVIHKEDNLIDVSDDESQFDSSEDDSDDEQSDDEQSDNEQNDNEKAVNENKNLEIEELNNVDGNVVIHEEPNKALEIMDDKLEIKSLEPLVDYSKLTKVQLRNICEEKELTGWKSLNKGKLVELLQNAN